MGHTFYDLNVQTSIASGRSTVEEMVRRAEKLDIDHLGFCDYLTDIDQLAELKEAMDAVETDIDLHHGVKVRADDKQELHDKVSLFRDSVEVVAVHGGDSEINRLAAEDKRVDVLCHPEFKRHDSGVDHVIAKAAANNRVAIELNFRSVLQTYGKLRANIMHGQRRNIRLASHFDAPLILNSGAQAVEDMRKPRDMVGLATSLGVNLGDAFTLVEGVPRAILQRYEEATDDDQVRPGVTIEDFSDAEDDT